MCTQACYFPCFYAGLCEYSKRFVMSGYTNTLRQRSAVTSSGIEPESWLLCKSLNGKHENNAIDQYDCYSFVNLDS